MSRIARLAALAAGLALPGAAPAPVPVAIENFSFVPPTLVVPPGTTVVWTNADDIPHTVTEPGTGDALRSPPLDTGDRYAHRFDRPGTHRYFCSLHPRMQGTIVVR